MAKPKPEQGGPGDPGGPPETPTAEQAPVPDAEGEPPVEQTAPEAETLELVAPAAQSLTLHARGRVVAWAPKATETGPVCRITFETADINGADLELLWSAQPFLATLTLTFEGRSQRYAFPPVVIATDVSEPAGDEQAEDAAAETGDAGAPLPDEPGFDKARREIARHTGPAARDDSEAAAAMARLQRRGQEAAAPIG